LIRVVHNFCKVFILGQAVGAIIICPKKHVKKGFTIVEVAVVMLVISVLTGLISIMMPDILEKANRTVDESDVKNLNTATAAYKTLIKLQGNIDVFEGTTSDIERIQLLFDKHYISNVPVPNVKGTAFIWRVTDQKWVISGDLVASSPSGPSDPTGPDNGGYVINPSDFLNFELTNGFIKGEYSGSEKDIIIPNMINGVPVLGVWNVVFKDKDIISLVLEEGIKEIKPNAFTGNNINQITIGSGVTIGNNAFPGNVAFTTAYQAGGAGTYAFTNGN